MKFNTIIYERNRGGESNRQSLKLEIQVPENENLESLLDWVTGIVDHNLGIKTEDLERETNQLQGKKRSLERDIENLEQHLSLAKERWEKAKAFLEKHNISFSASDDIPF